MELSQSTGTQASEFQKKCEYVAVVVCWFLTRGSNSFGLTGCATHVVVSATAHRLAGLQHPFHHNLYRGTTLRVYPKTGEGHGRWEAGVAVRGRGRGYGGGGRFEGDRVPNARGLDQPVPIASIPQYEYECV